MSEPGVRELLRETMRRLDAAHRRIGELERPSPIAVAGMGLRLPGGIADTATFWERLRAGFDAVGPLDPRSDGRRDIPSDRDEHWGGALDRVDSFDAAFFGIPAAEARHMDPQQRLVLETAWEAIEDAGVPADRLRATSTGVYLGIFGNDYLGMQLADPESISAYTAPGSAHSVAANRLSYLLDLTGPSLAVDTACSSSLVAVHLAVQALRAGDCEYALVGGVNLVLSRLSTEITGKVLPLAPGRRCRSFDAAADGIVRAEGCVMMLLARDPVGLRPRAFVHGSAVNQDGRTNGLNAPNPASQRAVLTAALAAANVAPSDVGYLEAHGTGTALGDPLEIEAIREVYGAGPGRCGIGSVKANVGHLEAAAGVAGLAKAILVLDHNQAPPVPHLTTLNPEIDLGGARLFVPTVPTDLPAREPERRFAAVSSFGFGGTNANVVLGGVATPVPGPTPDPTPLVLPLSARDDGALTELAGAYADLLDAEPDPTVVCAGAAHQRTHHRVRLAVTGTTGADLAGRLRTAPAGRVAARSPRVAFVFSGQGAQWGGMCAATIEAGPVARAEFTACADHVRRTRGWSLADRDRVEDLADTETTQLATAAVQFAVVAQLGAWGIHPHAVLGHSMGEVVAAAVAGAMSRDGALDLLVHRAAALTPAAGGAMLSLGAPHAVVVDLIAGLTDVGVAAVNSDRSTVVSGAEPAIAEVVRRAAAEGIAARRLSVGHAFHSPLLDGADDVLSRAVGTTAHADDGTVAFYSTVTGTRLSLGALDARYWGSNLRSPVLLAHAARALATDGVDVVVEIGPHAVLVRDLADVIPSVPTLRRERPAASCLADTVATLYEHGVDPHWATLLTPDPGRIALPRYPWQRRRHWLPDRSVATTLDSPRPANAPMSTGDRLLGMAPGQRLDFLRDYVAARAATILGVSSVDPYLPLDELGLDSTAVVELKNQAERDLGRAVALDVLMSGATVAALAERLTDLFATPRPTDAERLLADLDSLSDDEVEAALHALTKEHAND